MSDCDFYFPEEKKADLKSKFGISEKFVISYLGAMGVANGLEYFLQCAQASQNARLPVQFILCGDGAIRNKLIADAEKLNLKNLTILPFANREGVKEIMNVTDAVFICYEKVPILETGSPNKYFDGLATGKLIVINFGGWIKKEIEEAGCGISLNPLKAKEFVEKIQPFLSDPKWLNQHQRASRALAETKYSRKLLSEAFAKLF